MSWGRRLLLFADPAKVHAQFGAYAHTGTTLGGERAHRLVQTSRFVRKDGRWLYRDGDVHT